MGQVKDYILTLKSQIKTSDIELNIKKETKDVQYIHYENAKHMVQSTYCTY